MNTVLYTGTLAWKFIGRNYLSAGNLIGDIRQTSSQTKTYLTMQLLLSIRLTRMKSKCGFLASIDSKIIFVPTCIRIQLLRIKL